ncbi:glycosyl hydrolase family 5, partial [candidate division KSB1 bacterium]|nr:glycosyl hydrolase family 5 [candidate division KSB1 bacterium]
MTKRKQIFHIVIHLTLMFTLFIFQHLHAEGFLKTQGTRITDENGQEVILRGIGLGGWMLQEGYMMQTSSFANAQFQLRNKIRELV